MNKAVRVSYIYIYGSFSDNVDNKTHNQFLLPHKKHFEILIHTPKSINDSNSAQYITSLVTKGSITFAEYE